MARDPGQASLAAGARRRRRRLTAAPEEQRRVADAMVTAFPRHDRSTTVAELRAFFRDDHVHVALIVDGDELVGAVERPDLSPELDGDSPAAAVARLDGRTVRPDAPLSGACERMRRLGRRRLVVTTDGRSLLGLLCLKASGLGFCSDADVRERRCATGG